MKRILGNSDGALLFQVMGISVLVGILAYVYATYNANVRTDTSNKLKRYVTRDIGFVVQQYTLQPDALMKSETATSGQTFP